MWTNSLLEVKPVYDALALVLERCTPGETYSVRLANEDWQRLTLWRSPYGAGVAAYYWAQPDSDGQRGLFVDYIGSTQEVR